MANINRQTWDWASTGIFLVIMCTFEYIHYFLLRLKRWVLQFKLNEEIVNRNLYHGKQSKSSYLHWSLRTTHSSCHCFICTDTLCGFDEFTTCKIIFNPCLVILLVLN